MKSMRISRVVLGFVLLLGPILGAEAKTTFVFYYAWYGNPETDGIWQHWDEMNHRPPEDVASSYYPRLGAYSSNDANVVDQHMNWIAESKIDVLIYSWWGRQDPTEYSARSILDAAARHGLKVSFMIEPYEQRTINSMRDDIEYLNSEYGHHPAFFRMARKTSFGGSPAPRGVFFIFDPSYPDPLLRTLSGMVHKAKPDSILLLQSNLPEKIEQTHADGIFLYNPFDLNVIDSYKRNLERLNSTNDIYIPSVSPGFNKNRETRMHFIPFLPRQQGETYDRFWKGILDANPEFVNIVSFNEWHEGSQIEPAESRPKTKPPYLSYNGSYGKNAGPGQRSYLRRTAHWIEIYRQLP